MKQYRLVRGKASRQGRSVPLPRLDTIAFDLDGTLADTAIDLVHALNHALSCLGRPAVEPDDMRHLSAFGARALLRAGLARTGVLDEALVEEAVPLFLAHYEANICVATTPFPGAGSALAALADKGFRLAICSNKAERLARKLVASLGWSEMFASIVGGDTLPARKPDPSPLLAAVAGAGGKAGLYVGDSLVDVEAAKAASMPSIVVRFGFSDRPVEEIGADAIIDHFDDLYPAIKGFAR